jgi:hypothetical protein
VAVPGPEAVVPEPVVAEAGVPVTGAPAIIVAPVLVPAPMAVAAMTMVRAVPVMVFAVVAPVRPRAAEVSTGAGLCGRSGWWRRERDRDARDRHGCRRRRCRERRDLRPCPMGRSMGCPRVDGREGF